MTYISRDNKNIVVLDKGSSWLFLVSNGPFPSRVLDLADQQSFQAKMHETER